MVLTCQINCYCYKNIELDVIKAKINFSQKNKNILIYIQFD